MLGMNIYFAVRFSHINRPDSQLLVRQILMILVVSSVLFLSIPLVLFYKIVRRQDKNRKLFPAGEELLAIRKRRNQPFPLWFSITGSVFYLLLAIDETHNAMTNHLHPVYHWGFAAMIWALTAFFIVQIFLFRPSKRKDVLSIAPKEPQTPPDRRAGSLHFLPASSAARIVRKSRNIFCDPSSLAPSMGTKPYFAYQPILSR